MTRKIALGVLLPVIAIAAGVYFWLGGFRSVRLEEVQYPQRTVWGMSYQGKYGDIRLREIFVNTQKQLTEGDRSGTLVVVNYDSRFEAQEVNQLIGILPDVPPDSVRPKQTVDTLSAGTYVRVHVYGSPAVRPTPAQTDQKVRNYASQRGLSLGKKVIEHYFGPDSMWIEYPVIVD